MRIAYLLLAAGMGFVSLASPPPKRRFTVADDIGVVHFGDSLGDAPITFSPDGRYFVVDTERGLLDQDRLESTLRVYRTESVHQFLLDPELTDEPSPEWILSKSTYTDGPIIARLRWLSDSSEVAFLAKTATGNDQLFLWDLKTKTVDMLTSENQHVISFDIHDRTHFVYSVESPAIREKTIRENEASSIVGTGRFLGSLLFPERLDPRPSNTNPYDLSELWAVVNGKRFRVDSESSGRPVALHRDAQTALALSPDGRSVVTVLAVSIVPPDWETLYPPPSTRGMFRIRAGRQDREALEGFRYVSQYVVIELSTGRVKPLTEGPTGNGAGWSSVLSAAWSSNGEAVVLSNTFLNSDAKSSDGMPTRPCVAVVDLVRYAPTCLEYMKGKANTKSGWEDGIHFIEGVHFAPGSSSRVTLDYEELNGSKRSTSYIRSQDGLWSVIMRTNGWTEQASPIEIKVQESFRDPPVLVATDKTTKTSRIILDPNPQLSDIDLGTASVYKWKDKNGREWTGGLYKPSDYVHGQRYPLVVQTHGFYESLFRPDGVFPTAFAARELATAGIVVLQAPDCQYTSGPSAELSCNVAGYEAGVEKLVADGVVDPDRVGIVGFSRTCAYVLGMLTTSAQHFKAASITDGINFGYLQYITQVDIGGDAILHDADAVIGVSPVGQGLQQWFKRSPEFNMDKVTTPLQVVANGRKKLLLMWEPYAALRILNKSVDLIVLKESTHVLTNPAARMVSQGSTVDWFRFWLQDEEDPSPAKAEQYIRWRDLRKLQEENAKTLGPLRTTSAKP
jgi:dipeptidyl aminopeptidase/acylaminoacyl peptidase